MKNLHLVLSSVIVIPAALLYGVAPADALPLLFDFQVDSTDLNNVFRAIMGLYLGSAALWILGIFKSGYWKAATLLNIVFMLGLAAGRLLSIALDGIPSPAYAFGWVGELVLGGFALYQLRKHPGAQPGKPG
ncbi:DUF4345 domain-containing protein [Robiginitalea sediminis]|uniref:DUF4345 domain-containing protein n=1 Tax=Robiginitalea sediminis TaxID=1982593 RepID=UPI000B4A88DF|nr:DUF4345 domain-containing protein [Robiginitalea sediminis]